MKRPPRWLRISLILPTAILIGLALGRVSFYLVDPSKLVADHCLEGAPKAAPNLVTSSKLCRDALARQAEEEQFRATHSSVVVLVTDTAEKLWDSPLYGTLSLTVGVFAYWAISKIVSHATNAPITR
jgi:hypothetical protein